MSETSTFSPDIQRLTTTLRGGQADMVPLAELKVDETVKASFLGLRRWPEDRREAMQREIEFALAAGYDAIRAPAYVDYARTGETRSAAYGVNAPGEVSRTWHQMGAGPIRSLADAEAYPWPDPARADVSELQLAHALVPEGMGIITALKGGGIFERAWFLLGFEGFMRATIEEAELAALVMRRAGEVWYGVAEHCLAMPRVSVLWLCDDLAYTEGFLVNPELYRRHLFPWIERLADLCHRRTPPIPFVYHSDGRLFEVLEDLIACGVDALHPIEPKAMDIVEVRRRVGGRLCLIGNIDLGYTLTRGTPEEVAAEVRERIRTVGCDGAYCVGSSNSVTEYVPVANFAAMVHAAREYGQYPLS